MVYTQMLGPYKVSMLAQQIAKTYLHVHEQYINEPARSEFSSHVVCITFGSQSYVVLSKIGSLIEFKEDNTEEARRELIGTCVTLRFQADRSLHIS